MANTNPDYTYYTLEQLQDCRRNIDGELYPTRLAEVNQRISNIEEKRRQLGSQIQPSLRSTRTKAFIIDMIGAMGIYHILYSYLWYPQSSIGISIGAAAWFFSYFCWFEVILNTPSPGKKYVQLSVVNTDNQPVNKKQLLARNIIFTLIYAGTDLTQWCPSPVSTILASVISAIIIYNVYLAIWSSNGVLVHDKLSKTKLTFDNKINAKENDFALINRWILIALFSVVLATSYYLLPPSSADTVDFGQQFEELVAERINISTVITITEAKHLSLTTGESRASLNILVKIPRTEWNDINIQQITNIVVENLNLTPGYFDEGFIKLETSYIIYDQSISYELTLP